MSDLMRPGTVTEDPIVIHGPTTGDEARVEKTTRPVPAIKVIDVRAAVVPAPAAEVVAAPQRLQSLDAFRGLLLLAMNFTFTMPPWGPFADWMYHAQVPPTSQRSAVGQPGLNWPDLLVPAFIFTMSVAIPIALSGRLAKGMAYPEIIWHAVKRGALLLLLALLIGHVNPYWTGDATKVGNVISIFGLLVCFAVFARPQGEIDDRHQRLLRYTAWAGAATVLFLVPAWYGQSFSSERRDSVIGALAFLAVATTLIWLFTRTRIGIRLAVLAVIVAARLLAPNVAWVGDLWWSTPEWLYQAWIVELLLIAIPGTIVGDIMVAWMRRPADEPVVWSTPRLAALAMTGLTVVPLLVIGLYKRQAPVATMAAIIALSAVGVALTWAPTSARDLALTRMWRWTAACLVIGALVEPLEGGIRKDPQTIGYLLLTTGAAMAALASLLILLDVRKAGKRVVGPLVAIGQNSLFAYVVVALGILHVMWLLNLGNALTGTWQQAAIRSAFLTTVAGFVVWFATKKRVIWRT